MPSEVSNQIFQYLDIIMSSPLLSSATGDYVKAHQAEYDTILDMGTTELPVLRAILESDDRSLMGNITSVLVQDIVEREQGKPHSEWEDGVLQSALSDVERWSRGFSANDTPTTRDEKPDDSYTPQTVSLTAEIQAQYL